MGNDAKVDELGFVTPDTYENFAISHIFTRIPRKSISLPLSIILILFDPLMTVKL